MSGLQKLLMIDERKYAENLVTRTKIRGMSLLRNIMFS
jgi:hypothetical protein